MPVAYSREGFTLDLVGRLIRKSLLNPRLTGTAALVAYIWNILNQRGVGSVPPLPSKLASIQSKLIKCFLGGLALSINDYLNKWSHNNWTKSSEWKWDEEIVLITGGCSGMGACMVRRFLDKNPRTTIVIVDFAPLKWTPPDGSRVSHYQCDLNDSAAIRKTCEAIRQDVGDPTVLINNAGIIRGSTIVGGTYHDIEATLRVNLTAPILLMKEFLPGMVRRNHGHIVGMCSMSTHLAPPRLGSYAASKCGLQSIHDNLQAELRSVYNAPRVRVSLALPGFVRTPMIGGEPDRGQFVIPFLHPESVAESVVDQVYSGYGANMYLPEFFRYYSMARGGPEWFFQAQKKAADKTSVDYPVTHQLDEKTGHFRSG